MHAEWLKGKITFKPSAPVYSDKIGRPKVAYGACSKRFQRRYEENLKDKHSGEELGLACDKQFKEEGKNEAAQLVKSVCHDAIKLNETVERESSITSKTTRLIKRSH